MVNLGLSRMSLYPTKQTLTVSPLFADLTWSIICLRVSLLRSIHELIELVQSKSRQRSSCFALSFSSYFCLFALVLAEVATLGVVFFVTAGVVLVFRVAFDFVITLAGAFADLVAVDLVVFVILL
jgi:hypothetical protein